MIIQFSMNFFQSQIIYSVDIQILEIICKSGLKNNTYINELFILAYFWLYEFLKFDKTESDFNMQKSLKSAKQSFPNIKHFHIPLNRRTFCTSYFHLKEIITRFRRLMLSGAPSLGTFNKVHRRYYIGSSTFSRYSYCNTTYISIIFELK